MAHLMGQDKVDHAIEFLDQLGVTNDMFKEHLMDLCMNKQITELFEKLTTQQKATFTREYNKLHKDPTNGVRGKKVSAKVSEDDE